MDVIEKNNLYALLHLSTCTTLVQLHTSAATHEVTRKTS